MTGNSGYVVYCHTNKTNGKRYFGISKDISVRWRNMGAEYKADGRMPTAFELAIAKYGWDGFHHEILHDGLSHQEACELEVEYIKKFKTNVCRHGSLYGYNMTDGGDGWSGHKLSQSAIEKIRAQSKLRGISQRCLDASIVASQKSVKCVETGEVFVSATDASSLYGVSVTHLCACCNGRRHTAFGLHWEWSDCVGIETIRLTDAERTNIINAAKSVRNDVLSATLRTASFKKVECVETGVIYDSLTEAANAVGGKVKGISSCLRGRSHTSAGYHWRYA